MYRQLWCLGGGSLRIEVLGSKVRLIMEDEGGFPVTLDEEDGDQITALGLFLTKVGCTLTAKERESR